MTSTALTGVRVLDLTRLMPFSYGTQLLADAGADVIKVEGPGGEYGRGMDGAFRATNRGKRSIVLDLKDPAAVEVLLLLVERADVVTESFRPGYLERLGFGYAAASARNPRLVYVSATGYGQTGPRAADAGHDLNYAALAGLTAVAGGPPSFPSTPYIDLVAGWALALAVSMGVAQASRTGTGSYVDLGMADVALSLNVLAVASSQEEADAGEGTPLGGYPWPELMVGECPCYGTYETGDGRFLALANVEPKFWAAFVEAIDARHLEGARFAVGAESEAARQQIAAAIKSRTRDEWMAHFAGFDVCVSQVHSTTEALQEEHFTARGMTVQGNGTTYLASPLNRDDSGIDDRPIPAPGEDTAAVLGELGLTQDDIDRLTDTRKQER
jgi:alpha-methylacyl-CoA racemase